MKEIINKFVGLSGYQIKRAKYLYDPFQNLIKSINYFNVKSIVDVGANKGQFVNKLLKNGFNGNILSFEPLFDEHNYLKKISKKKNKWTIEERCALGKRNSNEKNPKAVLPIANQKVDPAVTATDLKRGDDSSIFRSDK